MATTLKQTESAPATYPDAPAGLSTAAAALDAGMVWQRIEAYTAFRYSARAVTWIVEGPGGWVPPLTPATISDAEIWSRGSEAWETAIIAPTALGGYCLPCLGPFRFTATVGEDDAEVPAAVLEAFRRLAEYMAAKPGKPGAISESISAGSINLSHRRSASWMAEAMQNSGAADLLRSYRRAA
ncbi:MAG: hypothetical protein AB7K64_02035 [Variibacter sp.]